VQLQIIQNIRNSKKRQNDVFSKTLVITSPCVAVTYVKELGDWLRIDG